MPINTLIPESEQAETLAGDTDASELDPLYVSPLISSGSLVSSFAQRAGSKHLTPADPEKSLETDTQKYSLEAIFDMDAAALALQGLPQHSEMLNLIELGVSEVEIPKKLTSLGEVADCYNTYLMSQKRRIEERLSASKDPRQTVEAVTLSRCAGALSFLSTIKEKQLIDDENLAAEASTLVLASTELLVAVDISTCAIPVPYNKLAAVVGNLVDMGINEPESLDLCIAVAEATLPKYVYAASSSIDNLVKYINGIKSEILAANILMDALADSQVLIKPSAAVDAIEKVDFIIATTTNGKRANELMIDVKTAPNSNAQGVCTVLPSPGMPAPLVMRAGYKDPSLITIFDIENRLASANRTFIDTCNHYKLPGIVMRIPKELLEGPVVGFANLDSFEYNQFRSQLIGELGYSRERRYREE